MRTTNTKKEKVSNEGVWHEWGETQIKGQTERKQEREREGGVRGRESTSIPPGGEPSTSPFPVRYRRQKHGGSGNTDGEKRKGDVMRPS